MSADDKSGKVSLGIDIDTAAQEKYLLGGERKWRAEQWTASDDRVRGGRSQSYLKISDNASTATFYGNLDITALGGAGFASQRTTGTAGGPWDLSTADGIRIGVGKADNKIYTLVLKDTILPKRPDGREQSTLSYEFSFSIVNNADHDKPEPLEMSSLEDAANEPYVLPVEPETGSAKAADEKGPLSTIICVPWKAFYPYYRGKRKPDADPLDTSSIKRISFMCRSMFGAQYGDFSLDAKFISGLSRNNQITASSRVHVGKAANGIDGGLDNYVFQTNSPAPLVEKRQGNNGGVKWDLIDDLEDLKLEEPQRQSGSATNQHEGVAE